VQLDLDDDQLTLRKAAREILFTACPPEHVRAVRENAPGARRAEDELWARLAGLDLLVLGISEEDGGLGGTDLELAILLEEAGRVAMPGPLLETLVATFVLAETAITPAHRGWLTELGRGTATATILTGEGFAAWAERAAVALVAEGDELHLVPAEKLDVISLESVDHVRPLATVRCTPDSETRLTADKHALVRLQDRLALAVSAVLVGIGAHLIETTVDYVRNRTQFGRPIGSFQAVKHRLAEAHLAVETARPAVWAAAQLIAACDPDASVAAAVARSYSAHAAAVVNAHALQCHGGIGFTLEYDLQLWLTLGKAMERAYGSARSSRARIADSILGPLHADPRRPAGTPR
jgi:alkylation response protein AidB-like acyl-CoA dehydrogenase